MPPLEKIGTLLRSFFQKNGSLLQDPISIGREVSKEFAESFTHDSNCSFDPHTDFDVLSPIISPRENIELIKEVSSEEIKEAVFQLAEDKAPGPDGYPPFFFQKYWKIVGNSVIRAVKAFFHSGNLLKEINHTFLALIPKIANPESSNHFRPISLCSTIYKIISKIMANRLKIVLGKIIHPLQGAFTPERLIQDNILVAHEVFHSFKNKTGKKGWMAIKLDMEKAYDRLEWNYIKAIFQKLGFHEKWVNLIFQCISTISFSVLINGCPEDRFFPSRGIRLGDPLPPYIFILCAEQLARTFHLHSLNSPKLIGVSPGHSRTTIPFLTFADDTMIFAKASPESFSLIKEILNKYCSMSGQLVNFNKSAFQCTKNVPRILVEQCKSILNMDESTSLGNYLGCPIIVSRVTNETFGEVTTKVKKSTL